MEAHAIRQPNKQSRHGPAEATRVESARNNEKYHQGLNHSKVSCGEEVSFGESLLGRKTILRDEILLALVEVSLGLCDTHN